MVKGGMIMKKWFVYLFFVLTVLVSCVKEPVKANPDPAPEGNAELITLNFTATFPQDEPATKARKTGWEAGDVIFVFSDKVDAPKYLKMSYDGSAWSTTEMNGSSASPGCMGLQNGDSGNFRAVYLPFGNNATISAGTGVDAEKFFFSTTNEVDYTYYMTATLPYLVSNGSVSVSFSMAIPAGFVQFFVVDKSAVDDAYQLSTDAVQPVLLQSVSKDGTLNETLAVVGGNMSGHVYGTGDEKGYLFSGRLVNNYAATYGSNYYFIKYKTSDYSREDYFVTGKTLVSHSAIKLPKNGNAKWQPVGADITVSLVSSDKSKSCGTWYTCNSGGDVPEEAGTLYNNTQAISDANHAIPTKDDFNSLITNLSWTKMSVGTMPGYVAKDVNGKFLFFPYTPTVNPPYIGYEAYYWAYDSVNKYAFYFFIDNNNHIVTSGSNADKHIRFMKPAS